MFKRILKILIDGVKGVRLTLSPWQLYIQTGHSRQHVAWFFKDRSVQEKASLHPCFPPGCISKAWRREVEPRPKAGVSWVRVIQIKVWGCWDGWDSWGQSWAKEGKELRSFKTLARNSLQYLNNYWASHIGEAVQDQPSVVLDHLIVLYFKWELWRKFLK